jgi:hypothetical protein
MRSTSKPTPSVTPSVPIGDVLVAPSDSFAGGWQEIMQRVSASLSTSHATPPGAPQSARQLGELLRLQMDLSRYQLRVEVVSKIAESAVASLRKLQQSQ